MFNPCPCTSLQTGAQIIAVIDGVITVALLILVNITVSMLQEESAHDEEAVETYTGARILTSVLLLSKLALAAHLYSGASQRKHQRCNQWLIFEGIHFIIILFVTLLEGVGEGSAGLLMLFFRVVLLLFFSYAMLVVYALIDELKRENGVGGQPGAGLPFSGVAAPYPYPYQTAGPQGPPGYYPQVGSAEQVAAQQYQYQYSPANYNYS